jgi:hypothetical protein
MTCSRGSAVCRHRHHAAVAFSRTCMDVCTHVCMYVRIHVYVCVCTCVYMYMHVYVCVCVCMHVCMYVYNRIHTYIRAYTHTYICIYLICMCMCVRVCVCVCVYIYVYISCVHEFIHITYMLFTLNMYIYVCIISIKNTSIQTHTHN